MAVKHVEIKKFLGLFQQQNSFSTPDGALEDADNVVITKDDRIIKRRGMYEWYYGGTDTLNNIYNYQQKIIAVFSDKVKHFSETGDYPNRTGNPVVNTGPVTISSPRLTRFVESNNNLYFTTDDGPLKLTAYDSAVRDSGAYTGLDMTASFLPSNGAIKSNTQVAWRAVFGYRDANSNLILGSPSDSVTLINSKVVGASWTRTANVVTVTSNNHNLVASMIITVSASTGTKIVQPGSYTIISATLNTFTIASVDSNDGPHTLDFETTRTARLEFSVPSEITSTAASYFYQIYRTSQSLSDSATPTPDYKLVDEQLLTAGEISSGIVYYEDDTDDILLGAELYTNPNSREGELQSNFRPPLCNDLGIFKNHVIYSNCTTRHLLDFSVVDTAAISSGDSIDIKIDSTTRTYVARSGVANNTVSAESVSGTGTITVTYTAHGLISNDKVYIAEVTGTLPSGIYTATVTGANTFTVTSAGNSATKLVFSVIENAAGNNIFYVDKTLGSVAVSLRNTAQGIARAINRDPDSLVYANYASGINEVPGKIRLMAKDFGDAIYLRASNATCGGGFSPVLPDSFSTGPQVFSKNEKQQNTFYSSKLGEPEAVPVVNSFPVGARNKAILRTLILRDSIIHLTEGGVYKTVGDGPSNFTTTILDTTVICAAPNSAVILNNNVVFLSNQGVCLVTENSVEIISRRIEDLIQPILTSEFLTSQTYGIAYESDRQYLMSTIKPNGTVASVCYSFNILNQTWTSRDTIFKGGIVGPNDTLYMVSNTNRIAKERKTNTKIDFSDQNHALTVISVAPNQLSAVISITTGIPEKGDVIVKDNIFSRVNTSTTISGTQYRLTFTKATNIKVGDPTLYLYDLIESRIQFAPFHGGMMGRAKQFTQMQIHLRHPGIYRLNISYSGYTYGGSDETEWVAQNVSGGWGLEAWGFFGWGQAEAVDLTFGTDPAPVIRTYISRFQQRNTFIQPVLVHRESGEQMDIQAVAFSVRPYMERVTK
jgi:hypothetical protein